MAASGDSNGASVLLLRCGPGRWWAAGLAGLSSSQGRSINSANEQRTADHNVHYGYACLERVAELAGRGDRGARPGGGGRGSRARAVADVPVIS